MQIMKLLIMEFSQELRRVLLPL